MVHPLVRMVGAKLPAGEGIVNPETSDNLCQWAQGLADSDGFLDSQPLVPPADGNWLRVFKPGSLVGVFHHGELREREIIEPRYIESQFEPGKMVLYYSYQDPVNRGGSSFTPEASTEPVGHDWGWVWWNPDTGEYRELEVSE